MKHTRLRGCPGSEGTRAVRWLPAACAAAALVLAAGCATSPTQAPVVERSTPVGDPPPERYVVQLRDSLYAIAWRYDLDYVALARWNGIGPPYTIYPGQTLVLAPGAGERRPERPAARETRESAPEVADAPSAPRAAPETAAAGRTVTPTTPEVRTPRVPETAPARPAAPRESDRPATRPTAPESKPASPAPRQAAPQRVAGTPGARWRWPVDVPPERGFGGDNKGVDYAVPAGRSVVAAAPGRVVYAGPGLAGYRHLVIVEHGGGYLSAYSLNADPEVGEGTDLGAGARLAAIGGTNATERRFHFEVRRHGAPIDPGRVIGR
ncbi:MAG: peptidoglycan DD-metalloendopeptidase family protein [Gammaproteobacteria bacterium]|nr:peptidoglycan DD-metalloendopeptidase family protein [Gammaproteobacteria bacterium]